MVIRYPRPSSSCRCCDCLMSCLSCQHFFSLKIPTRSTAFSHCQICKGVACYRHRRALVMCRTSRHKTLCRTCVVNFQPCTSAQTNSTPDVTLTLTLTLSPTLWGARGRQGQPRGSAACCGGVFPTKNSGRPKSQPRPIRPASCTKFCAGQPCT